MGDSVKLSFNFSFKFLSGYHLARPLSSSSVRAHTTAVDLDYTAYIPPNGNKTEGALLLLHGLLYVRIIPACLLRLILSSGSKRVWTSLSKRFLEELGKPIYALVSEPFAFYWLQTCRHLAGSKESRKLAAG